MRRVVVTGMGIVSSIGNNTQEVLASLREAKSGISACRGIRQARLQCQVQGMPTLDPAGSVDRRAMRFLGQRCGVESRRHGAGDPRFRCRGKRYFQSAHRHRHGIGRSLDRNDRRGCRHHARKGLAQAHRTLRGAEGDVVHRIGDALHLVQDQGRQLFDLVGLRDLEPLHRQRRRADPMGQAGHGVRRRLQRS